MNSRARRADCPGKVASSHSGLAEVIKTGGSELDLGPEGGGKVGRSSPNGTPENAAKEPRSYTGQYLAQRIKNSVHDGPAIKFTKARSRASKHNREA